MACVVYMIVVAFFLGVAPANAALARRDSVPVQILGQNAVRVGVKNDKTSFPVLLITAPITGLPRSCQITATANEAGTPTPFTYIAKNCTGSLTVTPLAAPTQTSKPGVPVAPPPPPPPVPTTSISTPVPTPTSPLISIIPAPPVFSPVVSETCAQTTVFVTVPGTPVTITQTPQVPVAPPAVSTPVVSVVGPPPPPPQGTTPVVPVVGPPQPPPQVTTPVAPVGVSPQQPPQQSPPSTPEVPVVRPPPAPPQQSPQQPPPPPPTTPEIPVVRPPPVAPPKAPAPPPESPPPKQPPPVQPSSPSPPSEQPPPEQPPPPERPPPQRPPPVIVPPRPAPPPPQQTSESPPPAPPVAVVPPPERPSPPERPPPKQPPPSGRPHQRGLHQSNRLLLLSHPGQLRLHHKCPSLLPLHLHPSLLFLLDHLVASKDRRLGVDSGLLQCLSSARIVVHLLSNHQVFSSRHLFLNSLRTAGHQALLSSQHQCLSNRQIVVHRLLSSHQIAARQSLFLRLSQRFPVRRQLWLSLRQLLHLQRPRFRLLLFLLDRRQHHLKEGLLFAFLLVEIKFLRLDDTNDSYDPYDSYNPHDAKDPKDICHRRAAHNTSCLWSILNTEDTVRDENASHAHYPDSWHAHYS
ncbi:hypothetical protein IWZ03DRAFT_359318 [Phyllosticta citriasiana]|uniref:Uncharacterized protein n=1 Tax=Phyllosticta citriasiana TaxID=595635 RepID=A0ABR1KV34_9PEZI